MGMRSGPEGFRTLHDLGTTGRLTDGQLLERYATGRGEAAAMAFEALLKRHGPMVLRVCTSRLADPHDAQDAFQAVFLVLIKRGRGLWVSDSLGPWLHQVALRTARCARADAARRRGREAAIPDVAAAAPRPGLDPELEAALHEEIGRLPGRYREPIILCDLQGLTCEEAARRLGRPVGTVKSWRSRGRERLRLRLVRRGMAPVVALAGSTAPASAGPLARILTARWTPGTAPASARTLARGVVESMLILKLKTAGAAAVALALLTSGLATAWALADGPAPPPAGSMMTRVQDEDPRPGPPAKETLTLRVVEATTREPLEGVEATLSAFAPSGSRWVESRAATSREGVAVVEHEPAAKLSSCTLTLRKAGVVPAFFKWGGANRPLAIPATKVVTLARGVTIGGVVNDEAGSPIEGATVSLSLPATESDAADYSFSLAEAKTDARGRWTTDAAPASLEPVRVRVEHPAYRGAYGSLSRGVDGVTAVLTKGRTVRGTVAGPDGRPVAGATATLGREYSSRNPVGKTGVDGSFALENCDPGPNLLTVEAAGFAPANREVRVADSGETPPAAFALEAGSELRVRVADVRGEPVAGVTVAAASWRGCSIVEFRAKTGDDGRAVWRDAPEDEVRYDVFGDGYMRARLVPIVADGGEHVVVLSPSLQISGKVVDAETGLPIPKFKIIHGRWQDDGPGRIVWRRDEPADYSDGRYVQTFDFPSRTIHLLVEAPGYAPFETRGFGPAEGAVTQDVRLEKAPGVDGVVLAPDGSPAADVEVALVVPGNSVSLKGTGFDEDLRIPRVETEADGRFHFSKPGGGFTLMAAGPSGFGFVTSEDLAGAGKLALSPWGRVEGQVRIGGRPGSSLPVAFLYQRPAGGGPGLPLGFPSEVGADGEGRFIFDKVIPGRAMVARVVVTRDVDSATHTAGWFTPVDVRPGETASVVIGGEGREVVGRLALDGRPDRPVDWTRNDPVALEALGLRGPDEAPARYVSAIDRDGRFRLEDVPPGRYRLTVAVKGARDVSRNSSPPDVGRAAREVEIPAGGAEPVDLGDVVARLIPPSGAAPR